MGPILKERMFVRLRIEHLEIPGFKKNEIMEIIDKLCGENLFLIHFDKIIRTI